jgi:hypothetical protein
MIEWVPSIHQLEACLAFKQTANHLRMGILHRCVSRSLLGQYEWLQRQ